MSAERTNPNNEKEHDQGLAQAKKRAQWELGDASWAGVILGAYLHPREDAELLRKEQER